MSNVIQFPIDRKVETIAGEIHNLQEEITERFEKLNRLLKDPSKVILFFYSELKNLINRKNIAVIT